MVEQYNGPQTLREINRRNGFKRLVRVSLSGADGLRKTPYGPKGQEYLHRFSGCLSCFCPGGTAGSFASEGQPASRQELQSLCPVEGRQKQVRPVATLGKGRRYPYKAATCPGAVPFFPAFPRDATPFYAQDLLH